MSAPEYGGPNEIPLVDVAVPADDWDNTIRRFGVVFACEWFGHAPDSDFTTDTIKTLLERSAEKPAKP